MVPEEAGSQSTENHRSEAVDASLGLHVARRDGLCAQAEGERRVEGDLDQEVIDDDHQAVRYANPGREDRDENGCCK